MNPGVAPARSTTQRSAVLITLGLAAAAWAIAVRQMSGTSGMAVATPLGSFGFFIVLWIAMMAAMMLPAAVPAVVRRALASGQPSAVPTFVASYLAVWTLVGLAVFALYRPHGTVAAGVITIAAGVYELTPLKSWCRQRCYDSAGSGVTFGVYCVGSSLGLMLILVALSVMNIAWMIVITVVVLAQKLFPRRAAVDVPLALAIVALGVAILVSPSTIPGLMPGM